MTSCNVQKCLNAVDETIEPLPIVGPLCDEHRARILGGEDYEHQGTDDSPIGDTLPTVLMDDSLRSLDQYVLLDPPNSIESGNNHGFIVPLQVRHRGGAAERELNLVIKPEMLATIAERFQHFADRFGSTGQE